MAYHIIRIELKSSKHMFQCVFIEHFCSEDVVQGSSLPALKKANNLMSEVDRENF